MLRYRFKAADALQIRFAISPLSETALSLRAFADPTRFPFQNRWRDRKQMAADTCDPRLLSQICDSLGHLPDFLTPAPMSRTRGFDQELADLRRADPDVVTLALARLTPPADPAWAASRNAPHTVADLLGHYWEACFAEDWPAIKVLLESDMVHRSHQLLRHGLSWVLGHLSHSVTVADVEIRVESRSGVDRVEEIAGRGLTLAPSLFTTAAAFPADPSTPPTIIYPARGQATLWSPPPVESPGDLDQLIGSARASLLRRLDQPRASTDLAGELHVTTSAVNQQLRLMLRVGLVSAARQGRRVLYLRSPLGEELLGQTNPQGQD